MITCRVLGIFRLIIVLPFVILAIGCGGGGGGSNNGNATDTSSTDTSSTDTSSTDTSSESSANGTWISQGDYGLSFTITSLSEPIVSNVGGTVIMPEGKCSGTFKYPGGSITVDKNNNDPSASTITVMTGKVYLELVDGSFQGDHFITIGGVLYSDNFSDAVLSGNVSFTDVFHNDNGYYEDITFVKQ